MLYPKAALKELEIAELNFNFRLKMCIIIIISAFCYYIYENWLLPKIINFDKQKFNFLFSPNLSKVFSIQQKINSPDSTSSL